MRLGLKIIIYCAALFSSVLYAQQNILIYAGPGVGAGSLANTVATIKQLVATKYNVIAVGPEIIHDPSWLHTTALLVLPGGADRAYLASLKGVGNENIKQYVASGGKFIGICAGAYYAADRIEFAKGQAELAVVDKRELKFFPGVVVGPTYAGYDHRDPSFKGARAAKIYWLDNNFQSPFKTNQALYLYYNGGGHFITPDKYNNVAVLARYSSENSTDLEARAAIITCRVGAGRVVLSGVHFEWDPQTLDLQTDNLRRIKLVLATVEEERLMLAKFLLAHLDVELK